MCLLSGLSQALQAETFLHTGGGRFQQPVILITCRAKYKPPPQDLSTSEPRIHVGMFIDIFLRAILELSLHFTHH